MKTKIFKKVSIYTLGVLTLLSIQVSHAAGDKQGNGGGKDEVIDFIDKTSDAFKKEQRLEYYRSGFCDVTKNELKIFKKVLHIAYFGDSIFWAPRISKTDYDEAIQLIDSKNTSTPSPFEEVLNRICEPGSKFFRLNNSLKDSIGNFRLAENFNDGSIEVNPIAKLDLEINPDFSSMDSTNFEALVYMHEIFSILGKESTQNYRFSSLLARSVQLANNERQNLRYENAKDKNRMSQAMELLEKNPGDFVFYQKDVQDKSFYENLAIRMSMQGNQYSYLVTMDSIKKTLKARRFEHPFAPDLDWAFSQLPVIITSNDTIRTCEYGVTQTTFGVRTPDLDPVNTKNYELYNGKTLILNLDNISLNTTPWVAGNKPQLYDFWINNFSYYTYNLFDDSIGHTIANHEPTDDQKTTLVDFTKNRLLALSEFLKQTFSNINPESDTRYKIIVYFTRDSNLKTLRFSALSSKPTYDAKYCFSSSYNARIGGPNFKADEKIKINVVNKK